MFIMEKKEQFMVQPSPFFILFYYENNKKEEYVFLDFGGLLNPFLLFRIYIVLNWLLYQLFTDWV